MKHFIYKLDKPPRWTVWVKWLCLLLVALQPAMVEAQPRYKQVSVVPTCNFFTRCNNSNYNDSLFYYYIPPDTANKYCRFYAPNAANDDKSKSIIGFIELADGCFSFTDEQFIVNQYTTTDPVTMKQRDSGFSLFCMQHKFDHRAKYDSVIGGNDALIKVTGVYGTPPRPRPTGHSRISELDSCKLLNELSREVTDPSYSSKSILKADTALKLQSNIWNIAPDDEMTFVITYKLSDTSSLNRILFGYGLTIGANGVNKETIFNTITTDSKIDVEYFPATPNEEPPGTASIKAIRCYGGEPVYIASGYPNSIIITPVRDGNEHNIFISLKPKDAISISEFLGTGYKAVVLAIATDSSSITTTSEFGKEGAYNSKLLKSLFNRKFSDALELPIAKSHDPNQLFIFPRCTSSKSSSDTLEYEVRFQNMGKGTVNDSIVVKVSIDSLLDINAFLPETVSATCGDYMPKLSRPSVTADVSQPFTYNINGHTLSFFIRKNGTGKPLLSGASSIADLFEKKTNGSIRFKIKTKGRLSAKETIHGQAAIRFDTNDPVLTDPVQAGNCGKNPKWKRCYD